MIYNGSILRAFCISFYCLCICMEIAYSQSNNETAADAKKIEQSENMKKMAELLRNQTAKLDYNKVGKFLVNDRGVSFYRKKIKTARPDSIPGLRVKLAQELLVAGKTKEAIAEIEGILKDN